MSPASLLWAALARLGERAAWTFVEVFLATFAVATSIDATTPQAAAAAGVAAAIAVVLAGIPDPPVGLPFVLDLFYRVARTFGQSVLAALSGVVVFDWTLDLVTGAVLLAVPAVAAAVKGLVFGRMIGDRTSAATVPASVESRLADPAAFLAGNSFHAGGYVPPVSEKG